jgi:branched-chain amino acid transport system ATP-binding protein
MDAILQLEGVSRAFGGLMAVGDVGFSVQSGEIFGLIGPNGAGKTTLFNLISGITPVSAGRISFLGQDILGVAPHKVAGMGMARTFQNIRLFAGMSVLDNVRAPMQAFSTTGLFSDLLGLPASRAQETQILATAMELLALSDWTPRPPPSPRPCPTANADGSKSRAPWPCGPNCCCWTSLPPASIWPKRPN